MHRSRRPLPVRRWALAWVRSDLIAIPFTLAVFAILVLSLAGYLLLGNVVGLFVGALFFILGLGGLVALTAAEGRRRETTEEISKLAAGGPRRVLVIANEGLQSPALRAELCERGRRTVSQALVVAPVVASSRLHAMADDVDRELRVAERGWENAERFAELVRTELGLIVTEVVSHEPGRISSRPRPSG